MKAKKKKIAKMKPGDLGVDMTARIEVWIPFRVYSSGLGSAIKNLGLFSKSTGDFKMENMDFSGSLGRCTSGEVLPRVT